jgi:tocopherol O-methyltransferase
LSITKTMLNNTTRLLQMVDVGCGIGGSSRYIAKRFGSSGKGITLSPVQAARANALTAEAGLADRVSFQVADALQQPFAAGVPHMDTPFV